MGTNFGSGGAIIALNQNDKYEKFNAFISQSMKKVSLQNQSYQTLCDSLFHSSQTLCDRTRAYADRAALILDRVDPKGEVFIATTDRQRPTIELDTSKCVVGESPQDKREICLEFMHMIMEEYEVEIYEVGSFGFMLPSYGLIASTIRFSCGLLEEKENEMLIALFSRLKEFMLTGQ